MNFAVAVHLIALGATALIAADPDPLGPWRLNVTIRPVSPQAARHTIHSYFNTSPESPDGSWILFFASTTADAHRGDVCIRNRETGEEKVLAKDLHVEDAHRTACQQWVSGGTAVVYHGERGGQWFVGCVDVETGRERVMARNQLLGWGQPHADVVPLYGLHWDPGPHRSLDLLNLATGEVSTAVTPDALKAAYPEWWQKNFADAQPSIFFPILSPDLQRVFFKMAVPGNGDARSSAASARQGLICYSLTEKHFLCMNPNWGHPSWHPDSRHIIQEGNRIYDSDDALSEPVHLQNLPRFRGDHPSVSPDGRWRVTDTMMGRFGATDKEWGVVVSDAAGTDHLILHRFRNDRGARSWRRSHPHPAFSADSRRIYFNVSDGEWTRLHVADIGKRQ